VREDTCADLTGLGLWRAGMIATEPFSAGVAAVVLVLLGGTTWASDGFWAPDGAYSRFISPIIALGWIAAVSWFLAIRAPSTERARAAGDACALARSGARCLCAALLLSQPRRR
jgi:hypothetical protein